MRIARREVLAYLLSIPWMGKARAQSTLEAMPFSSLKPGAGLPEWLKPVTFPTRWRHTEFSLVEDEGRTALRARADDSTSGIARALPVDPRRHPLIAWRWKVMNLVPGSDISTKAGDDFPARLYISFDGNRRALCYVWDNRRPVGTVMPNAYSGRVQMVVADSGPAQLARWVSHERDWVADYRRGFGAEPPAAEGVVVSADTDNTGEKAESYFGDVLFKSRPTS